MSNLLAFARLIKVGMCPADGRVWFARLWRTGVSVQQTDGERQQYARKYIFVCLQAEQGLLQDAKTAAEQQLANLQPDQAKDKKSEESK